MAKYDKKFKFASNSDAAKLKDTKRIEQLQTKGFKGDANHQEQSDLIKAEEFNWILSELSQELTNIQTDLEEKTNKDNQLQSSINTNATNLNNTNAKVVTNTTNISNNTNAINVLRNDYNTTKSNVTSLQNDNKNIKPQVEKINGLVNSYSTKITNLETHKNNIDGKVSGLESFKNSINSSVVPWYNKFVNFFALTTDGKGITFRYNNEWNCYLTYYNGYLNFWDKKNGETSTTLTSNFNGQDIKNFKTWYEVYSSGKWQELLTKINHHFGTINVPTNNSGIEFYDSAFLFKKYDTYNQTQPSLSIKGKDSTWGIITANKVIEWNKTITDLVETNKKVKDAESWLLRLENKMKTKMEFSYEHSTKYTTNLQLGLKGNGYTMNWPALNVNSNEIILDYTLTLNFKGTSFNNSWGDNATVSFKFVRNQHQEQGLDDIMETQKQMFFYGVGSDVYVVQVSANPEGNGAYISTKAFKLYDAGEFTVNTTIDVQWAIRKIKLV